jgi:drug/metabolite transporter (DMT)-like permease
VGLELAGDEVCLLGMAAAVSAGLGRRDRCGGACALCCRNRRQPEVPADQWPRLIISAILNVAVMSYALLWLPASEAVVIAYTIPMWTALLA